MAENPEFIEHYERVEAWLDIPEELQKPMDIFWQEQRRIHAAHPETPEALGLRKNEAGQVRFLYFKRKAQP